MRHFIGAAHRAALAQRTPPSAPARSASGMFELTAPTALIALGGVPPPLAATRAGARPTAILLTAVAMRAQQHLVAAPRAQEQAGATVHVHLGRQAKGCWTDSSQGATLLLHRLHRHGVGRGAVPSFQASVTAAVPTYFGIVGVVPPALAHVTGRATAAAQRAGISRPSSRLQRDRLRLHGRPRAAMQANLMRARSASAGQRRWQHHQTQNRVLIVN